MADNYFDQDDDDNIVEDIVSSRVTLVGAAYFGGLRLMRGLSGMSFREKIDAFLVKKNILVAETSAIPGIVQPRSPKATIDVMVGNGEDLGPGIPGESFEEDGGIFGPRAAREAAYRQQLNRKVIKTLDSYKQIMLEGSSDQKQHALNAIAHVVSEMQTRSLFKDSGIVADIKPEDIYMQHSGEYQKVLNKLAITLEDAPASPDVARLAAELDTAKKRFIDRSPMKDLDRPVDFGNYVINDQALQNLEGFGISARPSVTQNSANLEVQKEIWATRGREHGITDQALRRLNQVLAEKQVYDGGFTLGNTKELQNLSDNRTNLKRTLSIWASAEGVDSVGLVDVKTIKGVPLVSGDASSALEHQVATIRITASSPADPKKKVVDFREVPLLSRFNTFAAGDGSNVYAASLHVPEHVWDKDSGILRPGGRRDDVSTAFSRYNQLLERDVEKEVREMIEGRILPGGTISVARDLNRRNLRTSYLQDAQLVNAQNLYTLSQGAQLTYGAQQAVLEPKGTTLKKRLNAINQFRALKKGMNNREKLIIDIETLSDDPTAHPNIKPEFSEIYQISAIKTDAKGNPISQKLWWVKSGKPLTQEWARHTFDDMSPRELTAHTNWMRDQIKGGLEIHEVMNQLAKMMDAGPGELPPQIITHYGNISDMPTIRSIVQSVEKKMNKGAADALMVRGDDVLIDTWEMTTHGLRAPGQSLELEKMVRDIHGVNIDDERAKYTAAFERGDIEIIGGSKSKYDRWKQRYAHTHSSLFDVYLTRAAAMNIGDNPNNPISKVLGNSKQAAFYKKILGVKFDPSIIPISLNMGTLMAEMGVTNYTDELSDLFSLTGHPHSMGEGTRNAMSLADYIPFGQFYTAWRRGSGHKRLNTARYHHEAVDNLIQSDIHRGQLPGSTLWPHFVTDKMLELLPDGVSRAHALGHHMNATIAFSNTRFAYEGSVLAGSRVQQNAVFNQDNFKVQLPAGAKNAEIVGKSMNRQNPKNISTTTPTRTPGLDGSLGNVNPGEFLIFSYEDANGNKLFHQEMYSGTKAAIVRRGLFNELDSTMTLNRDIIQEFRHGIKGTVIGSNITFTPMEKSFYRMGGASARNFDAGRSIDILAGWDTVGTTKYAEFGRTAEAIMGKIAAPLLEHARKGNKAAEAQLRKILKISSGDMLELKYVDYDTKNVSKLLSGDVESVLTITEKRVRGVQDLGRQMNKLLNWNTVTDIYATINEMPELLPDYSKYAKGDRGEKELLEATIEMRKMENLLADDITAMKNDVQQLELDQKSDRIPDRQQVIEEARLKISQLEDDRKGLRNFISRHHKVGKFKFFETIKMQGTDEEFGGTFVTTGLAGISRKVPEELMGISPMGEPKTTSTGMPIGMAKLRAQSIQLIDDGWRGMDVDETHRKRLLDALKGNQGSVKYPVLGIQLKDVEYVLMDGPLPKNVKELTQEMISTQVQQIDDGMTSVRKAMEHTNTNFYLVGNPGDTAEMKRIVTNVNSPAEAIERARMDHNIDAEVPLDAEVIPMKQAGQLMKAVDPSMTKGSFIESEVPMMIKVPEHLREFNTVNFSMMRDELTKSMSNARAESIIERVQDMMGQGRDQIRIPALGISGRGRMNEQGAMELSRLQISAFNLLKRFTQSIGEDVQHQGALTTHVTKFYTQMAKFVGRHSESGKAATSYLPQIRGIAEPISNTALFQTDPTAITSKYNEFQTSMISKSDAIEAGIEQYLDELFQGDVNKIEAVMKGKAPIMTMIGREPNNYTTSVVIAQTFIMPDLETVGGRKSSLKTKQIGVGRGVIATTEDIRQQLRADFDSDSEYMFFMQGSDPEETIKNAQSMKSIYKTTQQSFMESHSYRKTEFIIQTGASNANGQKKRYIRQLITKGEGAGALRYVDFDDISSGKFPSELKGEIDLMHSQMDALPRADTNMYKLMHGAKDAAHLDVTGRTLEDANVTALLKGYTGKVTAVTWQMRSAFEIMEAKGLGTYEELELFRKGQPYPKQLVMQDGIPVPASQVKGLLMDTMPDARTMTGADILAELMDELTISKRKKYTEAAANIENLNVAMNPSTPVQERVERLLAMSTKGKQILGTDMAHLTSDLVDVFNDMEGSDIMKTMYGSSVGARDPSLGEVMSTLKELEHSSGIPVPFGMELLMDRQIIRENRQRFSQMMAEDTMKGTSQPMYFGKRSFRRMVADHMGMDMAGVNRGLRYAGIGLAAAAGVNFLFPEATDWFIGGDAQGFGGERYDMFGDGVGLPSQVPLAVPEYSWDTFVRTAPNESEHNRKREYANFNYRTQPGTHGTFSNQSGASYPVGYYNHRSTPTSTHQFEKQQQTLNPFLSR
jgi:hypothetical protein